MGKGGQKDNGEILLASQSKDTSSSSPNETTEQQKKTNADLHVPVSKVSKTNGDGTAATSTTNGSKGSSSSSSSSSNNAKNNELQLPWYRRGGMHVNEIGMGLNVTVPPIFLAVTASASASASASAFTFFHYTYTFTTVQIFGALFFLQVISAFAVHGMRGVFCTVAVPCYLTSLLVLPCTLTQPSLFDVFHDNTNTDTNTDTSSSSSSSLLFTLTLILLIAIWRVAVCMSVCLHRYAAHAAFKCAPTTQLFLNLLGCAAHQGGPVWWASMHRCHHKYCDLERDPHSAIQVGVERAFSFFQDHSCVEEEFVPRHNDTWYLRLIDTWSFGVATLEMMGSYALWGRYGLFVSYTSMWICQTITLWFNVANHPIDYDNGSTCKAANHKADPMGRYPAFLLLDLLYPLFGVLVSEGAHEDHHNRSTLAKRERYDCAYWTFVYPMECLGLVWDVKKCDDRIKVGGGGGGDGDGDGGVGIGKKAA